VRILPFQLILVLMATQCFAVRRPKYESSNPDTLRLSHENFRNFQFKYKAGSDLENLGLGLTAASVITPFLLQPVLKGTGFGGEEFTIFALAIFPTAVSVMATGNYLYGRSAILDTNNTYSISKPILPYTAYAATVLNYAILWKYLGCEDSEYRRTCTSSVLYVIPFLTEVALVPILRMQFNRAKEILDNVEVVVSPDISKVTLNYDF
jgi:hypothetical protein